MACKSLPETDPRLVLCLSTRIEATRRDGMVSIRPESPLFNLSVHSMRPVSMAQREDDAIDADRTQRFALVYSLVDSRDSNKVVRGIRRVRIDCPVGDKLVVT
jgi:hypothetical protein